MVRLLEQISPVQVQAMQPWWLTCRFEGICIVSGVLAFHRREARQRQVGEVATKVGVSGILDRHICDSVLASCIDICISEGQIYGSESLPIESRCSRCFTVL